MNAFGELTTWTFENTVAGKLGTLTSVALNNGTSQSYSYDALGRITSQTETTGSESFTKNYTYDSYGRVEYENWHTGFGISNVYNGYGYLSQVKTQDNEMVWSAPAYNARGQVTAYDLGIDFEVIREYDTYGFPSRIKTLQHNNPLPIEHFVYDFDKKRGNLISRDTYKYYRFEDFRYDELNRLVTDSLSSTNYRNTNYADNGNIEERTDIGIYNYSQQNAGPHAVTSLSNTTGTLLPTTSQAVDYTAFNKASHITQGSKDYFITYGPDRLRTKTSLQSGIGDDVLLTKYYALGDFEKETDADGTRQLHYIAGGDGLAAIYVKYDTGADSLFYIMQDHLGSLVGVINAESDHVYRQSFDAWGRARNPENWTYANIPDDFPFLRGYTGHEHLKWFGLINMNGRLYDASLCRFLSPDPYVQMPDNSQNFNRYSYCLNNPLVYTDPSGEFIIEAMIIGALLNVTFQGLSGNIDNLGDGLMAAGIGALAGASGAYLACAACVSMGLSATGVTSGVVWGGTAGLTSGFIGGAGNSWMNGSNFGDGLVDGLAAGGFGMMTGGILGGVGGGLSAISNNRNLWSGSPNMPSKLNMNSVYLPGSQLKSIGRKPDLSPMIVDSELDFDGEYLHWVDNYSDGTQKIRDTWPAWSGGCPPRSPDQWGGRIPNGPWVLNSVETGSFQEAYMLHDVGFKGRISANFNLLPPREVGTFQIHPDGNFFGSNGCIVLQCGTADRLRQFVNYSERYLWKCGFMNLNVNY